LWVGITIASSDPQPSAQAVDAMDKAATELAAKSVTFFILVSLFYIKAIP
jgi:hypothetical protein